MKTNKVITRKANLNDIEIILTIAYSTWPIAYSNILSKEQLDYMLTQFYSIHSLQNQFEKEHIFLIAENAKNPVGFASYSNLDNPSIYKLHKLYVLPDAHNKGIGKTLLNEVIHQIKLRNGKSLILNVNRNNIAKDFYLHMGFEVTDIDDIDIGNGFYMNDFIMTKKL